MKPSAEPAVKKYIEIAERIRKDIESGVYREGERIPPIRRLSELYDANPQTVNKATAYLASLGLLVPRQGSGSVVRIPETASRSKGVSMLIDRSRSLLLSDLDNMVNHHGKDIYLSYLMEMSRRELPSGFIVYDRDTTAVPQEFVSQLDRSAGFIVQGTLPEPYLKVLAAKNVPTVFINRPLPGPGDGRFGAVMISLDQIGGMMNYLLSLGHQKILYLFSREFEENEVFTERYEAALSGIGSWNLPERPELRIFRFCPGDAESLRSLEALTGEGFTAGFGYNDASALSFYPLLAQCGRRIPKEFSVVGFDDIAVSRLATPPLTTIRVNRQRIVQLAFTLLDRLSGSGSGARMEETLPTELVFRSSAYMRR